MTRAQIFMFDVIIATTAFILMALFIASLTRSSAAPRQDTYIFCMSALEALKGNSTLQLIANNTLPESILNSSLSKLPSRFGYEINMSVYSLLGGTSTESTAGTILSNPDASGHVGYDEYDYYVEAGPATSKIGIDDMRDITPLRTEYHSYASFDASSLPDDATIDAAKIVFYIDSYETRDVDPRWDVNIKIGTNAIGPSLTSDAYNNEKFVTIGTTEFSPVGELTFQFPEEYLSSISLTDITDFELVPTWGDDVKDGQKALVIIRQEKYGSNGPQLKISYTHTVGSAPSITHYRGVSGNTTYAATRGNIVSVESSFVTVNATPQFGTAHLRCWVKQ